MQILIIDEWCSKSDVEASYQLLHCIMKQTYLYDEFLEALKTLKDTYENYYNLYEIFRRDKEG